MADPVPGIRHRDAKEGDRSRGSRLANLFISPGDRRLRAAWRLAIQFALLLVLTTLLITLLFSIGAPLGIRAGIPLLLETQLSTTLGVTLSVYLARRWLDRRSFTSLGLQTDRHGIPDFLFGFALLGGLTAARALVGWSLGWFTFEGFAWQVQPPAELLMGLIVSLSILATVAWTEELFYRGYFLQNVKEGWNLKAAVILTSLLFAAVHTDSTVSGYVQLFCGGLLLGFAYLRTLRLWLPIGLHLGWNFFGLTIVGVLGSYPYNVGLVPLVEVSSHAPRVAGPVSASSLMGILGLGLAAAGVFLYTRNRKG